ncbi:MAG: sugar phosphate nucleotidyltransferase [Myxococcota bacterium]
MLRDMTMKAVILAGGKGRRLLPYTTNFPKPLMPIGEKPILEIVIEQLKNYNFKEIIITTGHFGELIRAFFEDGKKFGVNITYSKEDKPLGTFGPLFLIKDELKETFLLMNGDVLTDLDFSKFVEFHKKSGGAATVALAEREVNIDFGVVKVSKEGGFKEWNEKPTINYLVSAGIYLFEPEALKFLKEEKFINLPDFIVMLKENGKKVSTYLHKGYWLDIGRPEDYEKACEDYEKLFG